MIKIFKKLTMIFKNIKINKIYLTKKQKTLFNKKINRISYQNKIHKTLNILKNI